MTAWLAGVLYQLGNLAMAFVLAAFVSLGLRALLLLALDRGRGWPAAVLRGVAAFTFLSLALVYGLFTAHLLTWNWKAAIVGLGTAGLVLLSVRLPDAYVRGRRMLAPAAPRAWPALVQVTALLALLLVATATLMWAGFLALTEDRPILLVDVTGETRLQPVQWSPPDLPPRTDTFHAHRVVFRVPDGTAVAEAWIYGDQVGVKGRVLRLSPVLNAAGVPNLFELQFAHNGYTSAERHGQYPHLAVPLPAVGPLRVHTWWRPLQRGLLDRWSKAAPGSDWAVRAATVESTYYPLVDAQGRPVKQTFRLVLTPGGLSSS